MFTRKGYGQHPVGQLRDEIDRLFTDFVGGWSPAALAGRAYPPINVWEQDQDFYAEAEVPGLAQDDFEILVVGNELTLKGTRKPTDTGNGQVHRRERANGAFARSVHLPAEVDASKVEATLRDGVLTIKLPKAEVARPQKVAVRAG